MATSRLKGTLLDGFPGGTIEVAAAAVWNPSGPFAELGSPPAGSGLPPWSILSRQTVQTGGLRLCRSSVLLSFVFFLESFLTSLLKVLTDSKPSWRVIYVSEGGN